MSARPASIHIDDLAAPQFAPHVAEMMQAVEPIAAELELTPDALVAQAQAETGLHDFGDESFWEPLSVLVGALDSQRERSAMGRVSAHAQVLQLLKNRLLVEDLVLAHPEILDVAIERSIFIVGQPRTGTTHLHNLIAADPAVRSLPYWESLEPVLPADERAAVAAGSEDPRRERTGAGLRILDEAMPHFKRMHEMTVDHVHEEIQLLAIDFSTMLFETMGVLPAWKQWYVTHDQTPHYEYLRKVLQVLQWQRPSGARWVLKSPQHLEQFQPLLRVFPDATLVVTHRDPVAVIASNATMLAYTARLSHDVVDPKHIGQYWSDRIEEMLNAGMRDHQLLPPDHTIDVAFDEFMADDVAMVERIYRVADQPFTPDVRAAMESFMADHPRGRHGGLTYDLQGDFGIDPTERREAMRTYTDRFNVTLED
ncbi:MAG: sulfotransferase [Acidimicrobiia bacterium]